MTPMASMLLRVHKRLHGCAFLRVLSKRHLSSVPDYEYLNVFKPCEHVYHLELNRPNKSNALNRDLWGEVGDCFRFLSTYRECRSIILSGNGKHFCAGIDLGDFMQSFAQSIAKEKDVGRRGILVDRLVKQFQDDFTAIEQCDKPVIAAVHNGCIGGGLNLIAACDIRHCSHDAWFQLKEVDIGIAADVGALQRLPKVLACDSIVRELAYTAKKITSNAALTIGLVSEIHKDKNQMMEEAIKLAELIASKSPLAVQGTKRALVYARDHSVQDGLDQVRMWNLSMLQSEDLMKAAQANMMKTMANYDDV